MRWSDVVVVLDLDALPPEDVIQTPPVTFGSVTVADADGFAGAPDLDPELARRRLQRGDLCAAAWVDGAVVAHQWLAAGTWRMRDVGLQMGLQQDEAVSYDMVTAPEYRRRGLMQSLFVVMGGIARRQGLRRIYGRARLTNAASLATIKSVGFVQLLRVDIIRIGVAIHLCSVRVVDGPVSFLDRVQRDLRLVRRGIMVLRTPGRWRVQLNPRPATAATAATPSPVSVPNDD